MSNEQNAGRVNVKCRVAFPHLVEMNEYQGRMSYGIEVRIPKDDTETMTAIRKAAKAVWNEKFPDKSKWPAHFRAEDFFKNHVSINGKDGFFIRDGDTQNGEKCHGFWFFRAKAHPNKSNPDPKPTIVRRLPSGKVGRNIEAKDIYSGCDATVACTVYAFENDKDKGLSVSLNGICFESDNERWGNANNFSASEFGEIDEEAGSGADDEINYNDVSF